MVRFPTEFSAPVLIELGPRPSHGEVVSVANFERLLGCSAAGSLKKTTFVLGRWPAFCAAAALLISGGCVLHLVLCRFLRRRW